VGQEGEGEGEGEGVRGGSEKKQIVIKGERNKEKSVLSRAEAVERKKKAGWSSIGRPNKTSFIRDFSQSEGG
jgi:hypothetical protein